MKITVEFESMEEFVSNTNASVFAALGYGCVPYEPVEAVPCTAKEEPKEEEGFSPDQMQAGPNPFIKEEAVPFAEDPKPEPKPQSEPVAEAKSVSMDEVTALCMKLMDAGKQDGLIALLQQFGVNALPELKPAQLDQFYAQAQKMEG